MKIRIINVNSLVYLVLATQIFLSKSQAKQREWSLPPFPENHMFFEALDDQLVKSLGLSGLKDDEAVNRLADYFKKKAAKRYYFNWTYFRKRFNQYLDLFPEKRTVHLKLAAEHMSDFPAETSWQLPMTNLHGKPVTAYQFRHLARQSKIPDLAISYYLEDEEAKYIEYFVEQVKSLQKAIAQKKLEQGGNAVFEVFRAGKRVHHWLFTHHLFLATPNYSEQDQLLLIKMFWYHGQVLFKNSQRFRYGNHQTRGLVALFEIAALFPEFKQSKKWMRHALEGLQWHLDHEINEDGLQFERSGHYHKGDIENYLRVYQLAKINRIALPESYEKKFKSMFEVLVKLAMPNGSMPVMQDDTDGGSKIEADISEPLAVGAMIFNEPTFRYFASDKPPANFYWLLTNDQITDYQALPSRAPEGLGSLALEQSRYYVMRDGWQLDNNYMLISAGVEKRKPDHQHADVLGVYVYSGGNVVLPNYKVRYNRSDFQFLKNSWAKNVALVDSQPQGLKWQGNRGGSGFGKWEHLPNPSVHCWFVGDEVNYFYGSHDGFENLGVQYSRQILFIKNGFWFIQDNFQSENQHTYQQVWQGHFKKRKDNWLEQKLRDGHSFHIVQFTKETYQIYQHSFREHQNNVFQIKEKGNYAFPTFLIPWKIEMDNGSSLKFADYRISKESEVELKPNLKIKMQTLVERKDSPFLLLGVRELEYKEERIAFKEPVQIQILRSNDREVTLKFFGSFEGIFINNKELKCTSVIKFN